jgi:hypothetical protein
LGFFAALINQPTASLSCFAVGVFSMRWPLFRGWQKSH